jgi:hypothetical protein
MKVNVMALRLWDSQGTSYPSQGETMFPGYPNNGENSSVQTPEKAPGNSNEQDADKALKPCFDSSLHLRKENVQFN